jgi:hypothetical protein
MLEGATFLRTGTGAGGRMSGRGSQSLDRYSEEAVGAGVVCRACLGVCERAMSTNVHGPLSRHAESRHGVSSTPDLKQALELPRRAIRIVARTGVDPWYSPRESSWRGEAGVYPW